MTIDWSAFGSGVAGVVFTTLFMAAIGMALRLAYESGVMKGEQNEREKKR